MAGSAQAIRSGLSATPRSLIYVIDNGSNFCELMGFPLTTAGNAVATSISGAILVENRPGLELGCVVVDLRLPDVDDFAVLSAPQSRAADFPAVVVAGHGGIVSAERARQRGEAKYDENPVEVARYSIEIPRIQVVTS